jgi:hypothetical protein
MDPKQSTHSRKTPRFILTLIVTSFVFTQCTTHNRVASPAPAAARSYESGSDLANRPGLGTQLGHELRDSSISTHFYRKPGGQPEAVATFYYNDQEGARLMAESLGRATKHSGDFTLIPGKLAVTVTTGCYGHSSYSHYCSNGKIFVIGNADSEYGLKLENLSDHRLEVVTSIDGLNVLDGQPASTRKSGYVIPAKSAINIRGMKIAGKLRALKFGTVVASRAATSFGNSGARNIGVIGMALYEEDELARRRVRIEENYLRGDARAFGN